MDTNRRLQLDTPSRAAGRKQPAARTAPRTTASAGKPWRGPGWVATVTLLCVLAWCYQVASGTTLAVPPQAQAEVATAVQPG